MSQASPTPPTLAFIGLGALGTPMAANLLQAGHPLLVHNRTPSAAEPLVAAGARWAASPAQAAATADCLCLCLSDDAAVQAVLEDAIAGLKPGSLVIDFSTISPATSRAMATALGQSAVAYIDAPVTGGTEGARAGTLSVLVGADVADLERALPVLQVVGERISHLGPVGAGQQAKAVNQVLVAGSYAAAAEAVALAQRLELPMDALLAALRPGAAGSWALSHRADGMVQGHYPLGFKLALHRKDLAIAQQAAAAVDLDLPITNQVASMEDGLIHRGHGERDVSVLAEWFRG